MLNLFILPTCPYCVKVMDYMDEHDIKYEKLNIENPINEETLITLGGKRQVPFLVDTDNNVELYESDEIIEYLGPIQQTKSLPIAD